MTTFITGGTGFIGSAVLGHRAEAEKHEWDRVIDIPRELHRHRSALGGQHRRPMHDVLDQYVNAVGGTLEVNVVRGKSKIPLIGTATKRTSRSSAKATG